MWTSGGLLQHELDFFYLLHGSQPQSAVQFQYSTLFLRLAAGNRSLLQSDKQAMRY